MVRGFGLDREGLIARSPLVHKLLCDFRQRAGRAHPPHALAALSH